MPEYFIINILSELIVFLLNDDIVRLLKQYGNRFINFLSKISGFNKSGYENRFVT